MSEISETLVIPPLFKSIKEAESNLVLPPICQKLKEDIEELKATVGKKGNRKKYEGDKAERARQAAKNYYYTHKEYSEKQNERAKLRYRRMKEIKLKQIEYENEIKKLTCEEVIA